MQKLLACTILLMIAFPALAEKWVRVDGNMWIDTESMYDDPDGYTRFKTRELDDNGAVKYQHKEAVHCDLGAHYFRKMYDAATVVNNRDDSDVSWTDWRENPREAYEAKRVDELGTFVCLGF